MDRPYVFTHNLVSVDGRLDGFPPDLGLYYELAAGLPHDAVLTGSGTMLAAAAAEGIDVTNADPEETDPGDSGVEGSGAEGSGVEGSGVEDAAAGGTGSAEDARPLLVVVDGGGRLARFGWLRSQPYWRDVLILCSAATPAAHLDRLTRGRVAHLVAGDERVDLGVALARLADGFGVRRVRVDAGGTLNGVLLRAGLVDEVSVVIAPRLVGDVPSATRLVAAPDGATPGADGAANDGTGREWDLTSVERLRGNHLWLRYALRSGR